MRLLDDETRENFEYVTHFSTLIFLVKTRENPQSNNPYRRNYLKCQLTISTVMRDTLDDVADASDERLFVRGLNDGSQPRTGRIFMRGEREGGR